jgi:hypothetical protein
MPTVCTDLGTRMIVDQGGYSPIGCPVGPDCYDIIDAVTGQIVIAKAKGSMPWVDLCTQFGYTNPGGGTTPPPSGDRLKACELPGHPGWYLLRYDSGPSAGGLVSSSPLSKAEVEKIAGTTPFSWTTDCPIKPDERIWILCNTSPTTMAFVDAITGEKRLEQAGQAPSPHSLCPAPSQQTDQQPAPTTAAPTPTPAPMPTPAPAPVSAPAPEGPVPISIDIQAYTPGGTGPIPTQPLMQPQPIMAPKAAQSVVQPPVKPLPVAAAPKEPESKPLETGSAIGIGLVALTAIAAAIFGVGK